MRTWVKLIAGVSLAAACEAALCDDAPRCDDAPLLPGANNAPDRPENRQPTPAEIRGWVQDLESDLFATRERATELLCTAGVPAVEPVAAAALEGSLEATGRAVRVLSAIGNSDDFRAFETAHHALERLAESNRRPASRRALAALEALSAARGRHAARKFQELGGRLKKQIVSRGVPALPPETELPPVLVINRKWQGGDEGLVYVRWMTGVGVLYVTESAKVSEAALDELKRAIPHLQIQKRGDAMLGISAQTEEQLCVIYSVEARSPAERAKPRGQPNPTDDQLGLRPRDVIVRYDDQPIESFDKVIELTRGRQPGDRVSLDVLREGRILPYEIELGEFE
jgi:hypothetical protein